MFTISLLGQKGGTGKTTVALGLAGAAFRAGKVVAGIDLDPQASASNWKDRRAEGSVQRMGGHAALAARSFWLACG